MFCHSEMTLFSSCFNMSNYKHMWKTFPSFINLTFKCILFNPCNICGEAFQREQADIPHCALFFFFLSLSLSEHFVFFQPITRPLCSFRTKRFDAATLSVRTQSCCPNLRAATCNLLTRINSRCPPEPLVSQHEKCGGITFPLCHP